MVSTNLFSSPTVIYVTECGREDRGLLIVSASSLGARGEEENYGGATCTVCEINEGGSGVGVGWLGVCTVTRCNRFTCAPARLPLISIR